MRQDRKKSCIRAQNDTASCDQHRLSLIIVLNTDNTYRLFFMIKYLKRCFVLRFFVVGRNLCLVLVVELPSVGWMLSCNWQQEQCVWCPVCVCVRVYVM